MGGGILSAAHNLTFMLHKATRHSTRLLYLSYTGQLKIPQESAMPRVWMACVLVRLLIAASLAFALLWMNMHRNG